MTDTSKYNYWMEIATQVGKKSKCLSRRIGAVIVTPDGTIVGTGYNGPPRNVPHCDSEERFSWLVTALRPSKPGRVDEYLRANGWGVRCPRQIVGYKSGEGVHLCSAGHAERNAIVNSAREGIRTKGCYLVCSCPPPCFECSKEIINAGIVKVICFEGPEYDTMAMWLFEQAGVEVIKLDQERT